MELIPDNNSPVLVIDDDTGLLLSIRAAMASHGMPEPAVLSDSRDAIDLLKKRHFPIVLIDLMMPHISGLEVLDKIKKCFPEISCIIVTAVDDINTAVEAMKKGAYDYIVKPLNIDQLVIVVRRALERYNLKHGLSLFERRQLFSDLKNLEAFDDIVSEDESMALVFHQIEAVAPTDYSVVISGESGTGKEKVARVLHKLSMRSNAPFIAVNMASFSKTLFEDEFFGHKKGAFTDAATDKKGFFEQADKGTLFLDEIAELDMSLQSKLLRVIEEQEFYRLGSSNIQDIDVRIISATNRDINEEIGRGNFRSDLYYRLNMYNIKIPPLRERKNDILPLARHFLKMYSGKNGKKIESISNDFSRNLLEYSFPGNVRELENIIASAVLLEKSGVLTLSSARHLPQFSKQKQGADERILTLLELEKNHIENVLKICEGNRKKAAKLLGINTTTVYRKIEKYNIKNC